MANTASPNSTLKKMLYHNIAPVFNAQSEILILGSFPSDASRKAGFAYGHPQNRFWKLLADICDKTLPVTAGEKIELLYNNKIAIWDVIASCDIIASSDASIVNVTPNDISIILNECNISAIFSNGRTAQKLYDKYIKATVGSEIVYLPSTSPANASFGYNTNPL